MKNFLLPLLAGLAIGASAYHFFSGKMDVQDCFICIQRSDLDKVSNNKAFLDTVKGEDLIASFTFTTKINERNSSEDVRITRRITDDQAKKLMAGRCTGIDVAATFDLDTLIFALMRAKNIERIENVRNVEDIKLVTVFAKYPDSSNYPYRNRNTAIIQFAERTTGGLIDVSDQNGVVKYNFGNLCPDQCPLSLRPVTNPTDQTVSQ